MKRCLVEKSIDAYLKSDKPLYAVMISGAWGVGKSTLVSTVVNKNTALKPIFVSCFGVVSKQELENKIFESAFDIDEVSTGSIEASGKFLSKVADAISGQEAGGLVAAFSGVAGDVLKSRVMRQIGSNHCLIFDDIERSKIAPAELFSVINMFVEERGSKCIVVANEAEINNVEEFRLHKEKVIGHTCFIEDILDIAADLVIDLEIYEQREFASFIEEYNCLNIRTLSIALLCYKELKAQYLKCVDSLGEFDCWRDSYEADFLADWLKKVLIILNATKNLQVTVEDFELMNGAYYCDSRLLKKGKGIDFKNSNSQSEVINRYFSRVEIDEATWSRTVIGYVDPKAISSKIESYRQTIKDPLHRLQAAIINDEVSEISNLLRESESYLKNKKFINCRGLNQLFYLLEFFLGEFERQEFSVDKREKNLAMLEEYLTFYAGEIQDNADSYAATADKIPDFPLTGACENILKEFDAKFESQKILAAIKRVLDAVRLGEGRFTQEDLDLCGKDEEFVNIQLYDAILSAESSGRPDFVDELKYSNSFSDSAEQNFLNLSSKLQSHIELKPAAGNFWIEKIAIGLRRRIQSSRDDKEPNK